VETSLARKPAVPRAILAVLDEHAVDYLLIGGLAVIAHGYGRFTQDVDILPSPDAANMGRLAVALTALEAEAAGAHGERFPIDLSHPEGLALGNYFFETAQGGLDLVNGARPDLKRYRRLEAAADELSVAGMVVKVISKSDLIAMKREAGRDKDLRDIAALTEVERSRGGVS
jgi:hypothetical protein